MNKLAVFDFDSTLMDGETLEIIAKEVGFENKIQEITNKAMNGELDFFESLVSRVSFLKGLSEDKLNKICSELPVMKGAYEAVNYFKSFGYKVVCFSGGFKNATSVFVNKLNLDGEFSNILHTRFGYITGRVGGEMMFNSSKGDMLKKLQILLNVPYENTVVIGDGANDLSMFKYAKTKVAFCAKFVLKEQANVIIDEKDLSKLTELKLV